MREIAMYLAGQCPPFYGISNPYSFFKSVRKFVPITNDEVEFLKNLSRTDRNMYEMLLEDIKRNNPSELLNILRDLQVPEELLIKSKLLIVP